MTVFTQLLNKEEFHEFLDLSVEELAMGEGKAMLRFIWEKTMKISLSATAL